MSCNCNRIAARINRIYDGAKLEEHIDRTLILSDFMPSAVVQPLTYVNSSYGGNATITSQAITQLSDGRYRVALTYDFPVIVNYTNANGVRGTARSAIANGADILLRLPNASYFFEVETQFLSRIGEITEAAAEVRGCLLTIIKVIMPTDVVLQACDVMYPNANETDSLVCRALFDT